MNTFDASPTFAGIPFTRRCPAVSHGETRFSTIYAEEIVAVVIRDDAGSRKHDEEPAARSA